jgi:hypothetical protein
MVASIKGYVGPTWNASSKINGPSGCDNNVSTPACAEDWNQTVANAAAMWGAVPRRRPRASTHTAATSAVRRAARATSQPSRGEDLANTPVHSKSDDEALPTLGRPSA